MTAVRLALAVAATGLSVATAFVPHLPLTNARNLVTPTCASRTNAVRMSAAVAPVGTAKDLSRVSPFDPQLLCTAAWIGYLFLVFLASLLSCT